jgi:transketolase
MSFADLEARALRVREHIVRMSGGGGCFIGASLSCADLVVYLYSRVLRLSPGTLHDPHRDYFFLSKGHDVPALYGTLAELGYIDRRRLDRHLDPDDHLYWHPNRQVPGVEFHSGSLGHLLSVAVGVALDIKLRGDGNRVYVLLGDGELDEGSVWEAALCASAKGLDNLVVLIDRNGFQANIETEKLIPLEPLEDKLRAFGFHAHTFDGHSFPAMAATMSPYAEPSEGSAPPATGSVGDPPTPTRRLPDANGRPAALIATTVRGKGLPSLEHRADRWFSRFTPQEVERLLAELHGAAPTTLESPALVVR